MDRGSENEVTLDIPKAMMEAAKGSGGGDGTTPPTEEEDVKKPIKTADKSVPGRSMRIGGIALAGAGVLGIGISSVMTLSARGKYNDALDMYCGGVTNGCDAMGLDITHDARSTANTATVIFLVGTAAVAGGVVLYLLAPKASTARTESNDEEQASRYLVPAITSTGAGLVYGGRY
jgi:serine/threonine-protein kinase